MRYGKSALAAIIATLLPAAAAPAAVKTEVVNYTQGDTPLRGYVAYDDAGGRKRPGVLVVPEWWGLNDYAKRRAEQLAAMGYVALAVDMYGNGQATKDMKQAAALSGALKSNRALLRERMRAGLETLRKNPHVDGRRIAAIGYCFGGTCALELARSGADIAGAVTFHAGLSTSKPAEAKTLKAMVLVNHGADDPFVPADEMAAFQKEMRDAHADWQMNIYAKAVHSFTNPDSDKVGAKGMGYNAEADRRSWQAMKDFFDEIFGDTARGRAEAGHAAAPARVARGKGHKD